MSALAGHEGTDLLTMALSLLERDGAGSLAFAPGFGRPLAGALDRAVADGDGPALDALVRLSIALAHQFRAEGASRALLKVIKGHQGAVRLLRSIHGTNDAVGRQVRDLIGGQAPRRGPRYGQQAPSGTLKASSFVDPGRPLLSTAGASARREAPVGAAVPASAKGTAPATGAARASAAHTRGGDKGRRRFQLQQRGS